MRFFERSSAVTLGANRSLGNQERCGWKVDEEKLGFE